MNIGILGGSFDPIHKGHIHMAVSAYRYYDLDEVWLMPAGHSPNKDENNMTSAEQRYDMCQLASFSDERIRASRLELDSDERSYTYRTLERLREEFPEHHFYFIMGGDSLDYFDSWVKPERICELSTLLVVPRDCFDAERLEDKIREIRELFPCDIRIVPCTMYPVSSTDLRHQLQSGTFDRSNLPDEVLAYIREKHLYHIGT